MRFSLVQTTLRHGRRRAILLVPLVTAVVLAPACYGSDGTQGPLTTVSMTFARPASLYDAPFPSDDLRHADGAIDVSRFPNPGPTSLATTAIDLVAGDARGFSTCGGVFFQLSAPVDPTKLPDMPTSVTPASPIFLVAVDPKSPDFLKRVPLQIAFATDGGPFGSPNLLSLLPLQGTPLRPATTYAAVVTTGLADTTGLPLGASTTMRSLAAGETPMELSPPAFAEYESAIAALVSAGTPATSIAGLAVFTTDTPTLAMGVVKDDILARPLPTLDMPPVQTDLFPTFCVYQSTLGMPDYQSGTPPFDSTGGTWQFDKNGKPILQRTETARIVVTVPRAPMPAAGFPTAVLIRTGAGGDRPLVDRGPQAVTNGPAIAPGTGPALYFAAAGFAGVEVDGPLGGIRNTTGGNEDFLIFNIVNGGALRDNIRESAVEMVLFAHILQKLTFAAADCPGFVGPQMAFDMKNAALMGHSMGATIAPLVLAYEPLYRAAILSGAGASWIENILYKQLPLDVLPAIDLLLEYAVLHRTLTAGDPALSLLQWAIEPADPLVYTSRILREPAAGETSRHVLMEQGIVDHYILPPIANATSLSLGLDLAGTEIDTSPPEAAGMTPLSAVLPFSGGHAISLPAAGNYQGTGGVFTAVVVQHPGDGVEDGHEIVFQTDPPKHEYRCFLQTFLTGTPRVPTLGDASAPCN